MKTLAKLYSLVAPALLLAACGGDSLFPDLGNGSCPAGTKLYRVQDGPYVTKSVTGVTETCGLGLTAQALMSNRNVKNNLTDGTITISSADGSTILGTGPVRCNNGALTSGPVTLTTGACTYESTRTSQFALSADNTWTLLYSETRSKFMSVAGQQCTAPSGGTCTITFTLAMAL
jgi:hypothetical protein